MTRKTAYPTTLNESDVTYCVDDGNIDDLTPVQKFFDGASVFITGSTGFLGRILVEKLLHSCPTVSNLYLLIRNKKGQVMEERLDQLFSDVVFDRLKQDCPKFRHKVIGVEGDCCLPDLGLSLPDQEQLTQKINVVFHVAATVRFDEPLSTAVPINIRSPRDLTRLAKNCTQLKSFVHVSTIYCNCVHPYIEEKIYPPALDGNKLIFIQENLPETLLNNITPSLVGDYPNTYTYTKQIAEDVIRQEAVNLPVGIFRPAIVLSTYREPIPAWINNYYGPTGVVAGTGLGLLRVSQTDPNVIANVVPVDMCVNSLLVSAWEVYDSFQKARNDQKPFEIPVYNYESSTDQPITWGNFSRISQKFGSKIPTIKAIWCYCFRYEPNYVRYVIFRYLLHILPALLTDSVLFCMGKKPRLLAAYKKIHKFSGVLTFFGTRNWSVQVDRVRLQQQRLTKRDRSIFFSDIKQLSWDVFCRTYVEGIRLYLLKDSWDTLESAKVRVKRFYYAHQILRFVLGSILLWTLFKLGNYIFNLVTDY